jgi:site-specific recombinase XerD
VSGPARRGANGMGLLPGWAELEPALPQIAAAMRRYLAQISCVLRPGSVSGADLALRSFAAFLAETAPEVTGLAQVSRRHIEDYKPWLAARPGQNKPGVTTATLTHRLGTLRMFFVRIDEWGWDEAPPRVPMFPGDLPRQDHPLPRALDDGAAARLLRAAQGDKRLLVRVTVEMLLRTGLRVSEYTSLRADAVVHIGAGPCTSRSASSARTVTCRCTRTWSRSSTATAAVTSPPGTRCCCRGRTAGPWTGTPSPG